MPEKKEKAIITDKLVIEKTGRTIEEWFEMLDKKGATKMSQPEIFNIISKTEGLKALGEWNQNLLTTTYQWERNLRERGEKAGGFEISVSKTINTPVDKIYDAWLDAKTRNEWLPKETIIFRKATANKSARITWSDNNTSLSVDFYNKPAGKSQVVVQHMKIADSATAARMKTYWGETLEVLKNLLENKS